MPLSKADFVKSALQHMADARDFWHNWRAQAREDYDFVAGEQWLSEDKSLLERQKRPPITFNYSEKMIDAVVGAEVANRNEVTFRPRASDDFGAAELWTEAARWARQQCLAEFEEGDAFRDMLICGLGWTETRVSYDEDRDGKIDISRCDPLEMWSDPAATKAGLLDRRFDFREWWVDELEAKREWPGKTFTTEDEDNASNGVIIRNLRYNGDGRESDRHKGQVLITCYECVVREPVHRAAVGGQIIEMGAEDFTEMQDHMDEAGILYVRQYKNVYYRGFFSGDTLLEFGLSPSQDGFMYNPVTGKRDRNTNTWYGLTRVMKDPQRWANKWLSQILHIINSNAKGGLLAETNAFVDPKKAAEEWSSPDSITWLREGALTGKKVQERSIVNYPAGLDKLMQFALGSLPMVTGINLEALGLANREQAGVLEAQRKQAAYGLLSPLFDALRLYRVAQGRVLLHLMNEYIADGRLIRIGGPESEQFLPLAKQEGALKYDIIVDQSPNAPDVKERTWQALESLVPALLKAGMAVPPDVLDYAPIPVALSQKWKEFVAQNAQQMDPAQMQQMMAQMQQLQQENQKLQADHTAEMQKVQAEIEVMYAKLGLERQKVAATVQIKEQEAQTKNAILAQQGQQQLAQDAEQHDQQMQLADAQGQQQMALAEQQAANQHKVAMKKASTKPSTPAKGTKK